MEQLSLNSQFIESLECPICFDYFTPPIMICPNGHSICNECGTSSHICPICRADFLANFRNIALETMMEQVSIRCKFEGCSEVVSLASRQEHYRECPFNNSVRCLECHKYQEDMVVHLIEVHDYKEIVMDVSGDVRSFSGPYDSWVRDTDWPKGIWRFGSEAVIVHAKSYARVFHVHLYRITTTPLRLSLTVEHNDCSVSYEGTVPHVSEFQAKNPQPHFNCAVGILLDHFVKTHEEDEEILRLWVSVKRKM